MPMSWAAAAAETAVAAAVAAAAFFIDPLEERIDLCFETLQPF